MSRKYYKKRNYKRVYNQQENKLLFIDKNNPELGCWRFTQPYQMLDRKYVYSDLASGEGPITRHLCGDNKCVNTIHIVKGTDLENAMDEINVRDFSIKIFQEMIDENYDEYERDVAIRILLPRVSRKYSIQFKSMSELALYGRELYRREYVKKLTSGSINVTIKQMERAKTMLLALSRRSDISIVNG